MKMTDLMPTAHHHAGKLIHLLETWVESGAVRITSGRQWELCRWGRRWSSLWARDVLSWDCHIDRANDPGGWDRPIRDWHDARWLQRQRFENSEGNTSYSWTLINKL